MPIASRVLLPGSEPNWHGPATNTAGTSGRTDAFAQALPMWLSNAMVLQFFAFPMSFPGLGKKAISASLSSCGTRPVAAVSVHAAAVTCAHAERGACARCPTTAFQCSATALPNLFWFAGPPLRMHGPAFPFLQHCMSQASQDESILGLVKLGVGFQRKRLCSKNSDQCISARCNLTIVAPRWRSTFQQVPPVSSSWMRALPLWRLRSATHIGETAAFSHRANGLRAIVKENVASAQQVPKSQPKVEVFVRCTVELCNRCPVLPWQSLPQCLVWPRCCAQLDWSLSGVEETLVPPHCVGDGISVDPPLCRESRRVNGSSSRRPDCEGEGGRKIGEVSERERADVLSEKCCKRWDMTLEWQLLFETPMRAILEPRVLEWWVSEHVSRLCGWTVQTCLVRGVSVYTPQEVYLPANRNWS